MRFVNGELGAFLNYYCSVILPDGHILNHEIVKAGLAWWFRRYAPKNAMSEKSLAETRAFKRHGALWMLLTNPLQRSVGSQSLSQRHSPVEQHRRNRAVIEVTLDLIRKSRCHGVIPFRERRRLIPESPAGQRQQ